MPTLIQPYPMRSIVSEEGAAVRVSIPMQKNWFVGAFIACWLGGWTFGGLQVFKHLLNDFELFSAFWMGGWALGEAFAALWLLRLLGGHDIVVATTDRLEVRKEVFRLGIARQYLGAEIRDVRVQPESGSGKGHRESRIAFDYGAKTIGFGDGLDEAEANQLISLIKTRCKVANSQLAETSAPRFWQGQ